MQRLILIYNSTLLEYKYYVRTIIKALVVNRLYIKLEKYEFCKIEIKYLKLIILEKDITINLTKVNAII